MWMQYPQVIFIALSVTTDIYTFQSIHMYVSRSISLIKHKFRHGFKYTKHQETIVELLHFNIIYDNPIRQKLLLLLLNT